MANSLPQPTTVAAILKATDGRSELYDGERREKPPMSFVHNRAVRRLVRQLLQQLLHNEGEFEILQNAGHTAVPGGNSYIPDVAVVPASMMDEFRGNLYAFESYADGLPLIVEVLCPIEADYAVDREIPGYKARGDLKIWRVHPSDRVVTIWRRDADERYVETELSGGSVSLLALPDVTIDLDAVFGPG